MIICLGKIKTPQIRNLRNNPAEEFWPGSSSEADADAKIPDWRTPDETRNSEECHTLKFLSLSLSYSALSLSPLHTLSLSLFPSFSSSGQICS